MLEGGKYILKNQKESEREAILELYERSINDVIWTHKIQATLLDSLNIKNTIFGILKEIIVGLSSFVSIVFIYFECYIGALITNAISTISIVFDNIFKFSNYDSKIKETNNVVNDLWYIK